MRQENVNTVRISTSILVILTLVTSTIFKSSNDNFLMYKVDVDKSQKGLSKLSNSYNTCFIDIVIVIVIVG